MSIQPSNNNWKHNKHAHLYPPFKQMPIQVQTKPNSPEHLQDVSEFQYNTINVETGIPQFTKTQKSFVLINAIQDTIAIFGDIKDAQSIDPDRSFVLDKDKNAIILGSYYDFIPGKNSISIGAHSESIYPGGITCSSGNVNNKLSQFGTFHLSASYDSKKNKDMPYFEFSQEKEQGIALPLNCFSMLDIHIIGSLKYDNILHHIYLLSSLFVISDDEKIANVYTKLKETMGFPSELSIQTLFQAETRKNKLFLKLIFPENAIPDKATYSAKITHITTPSA